MSYRCVLDHCRRFAASRRKVEKISGKMQKKCSSAWKMRSLRIMEDQPSGATKKTAKWLRSRQTTCRTTGCVRPVICQMVRWRRLIGEPKILMNTTSQTVVIDTKTPLALHNSYPKKKLTIVRLYWNARNFIYRAATAPSWPSKSLNQLPVQVRGTSAALLRHTSWQTFELLTFPLPRRGSCARKGRSVRW